MSNQLIDLGKLISSDGVKKSSLFLARKREVSEVGLYIKKIIGNDEEKEHLIIFLRRHWVNLFIQLFPFLAVIIILCAAFLSFSFLLEPKSLAPIERHLIQFAAAIFSLFLWAFIFIVFIDYYLDVWVVTNKRIVNIEQKGLFRREISELRLENVQDLTTEISGVIPTFFDFGDLYVQTAGKRERFLFKGIPHPERVRDVILVLSEGGR